MENYIKNVAGTSMGAFFSLAFALKIPIEELEKIVMKTINNKNITVIPTNKFIDIFMNLGFNDSKLYLKELGIDYAVFDESHNFKKVFVRYNFIWVRKFK
jgi:predicted acylesterase/phospholipase RssA